MRRASGTVDADRYYVAPETDAAVPKKQTAAGESAVPNVSADPAVDILDITPVEHAVAGGHASALRLILDHVARPSPGYIRALRGAAAQGSLAMVGLLLAHGADPDARDSHGRTPLDWLEQAAPSVSRAAVRNLLAPEPLRCC
jgi:ankyrin repeat protein